MHSSPSGQHHGGASSGHDALRSHGPGWGVGSSEKHCDWTQLAALFDIASTPWESHHHHPENLVVIM